MAVLAENSATKMAAIAVGERWTFQRLDLKTDRGSDRTARRVDLTEQISRDVTQVEPDM